MIKFKQGSIGTPDGKMKDIFVTAKAPNSLKDILIGGATVLAGIVYLTYTAFRNGSQAYEKAEVETLTELGLMSENEKTEE